jgi:hypothetical protein
MTGPRGTRRTPHGPLDAAQNLLRIGQKEPAGGGEPHVLARAFEERHADLVFELSNLLAE